MRLRRRASSTSAAACASMRAQELFIDAPLAQRAGEIEQALVDAERNDARFRLPRRTGRQGQAIFDPRQRGFYPRAVGLAGAPGVFAQEPSAASRLHHRRLDRLEIHRLEIIGGRRGSASSLGGSCDAAASDMKSPRTNQAGPVSGRTHELQRAGARYFFGRGGLSRAGSVMR